MTSVRRVPVLSWLVLCALGVAVAAAAEGEPGRLLWSVDTGG
jgi:hypothetical protein